jgi:hypothetical protein
MANTLSSALVPDTVADRMVVLLTEKLAPLSAFASDYSNELADPKRGLQIPVALSGSTTLTNPTNFEQGDSEVGVIPVTCDQFSQPFHITNAELQVGHRLERLIDINLKAFANKIQDAAFAPITPSNFQNTPIVAATSADFDIEELKALWSSISDADTKNLILTGDYYSQIMPNDRDQFDLSNGAYGFDSINYSNRFNGADSSVVGFAADPDALVMAARIPSQTSAVADAMEMSMNVELPQLGLTVQYNQWSSLSSRKTWGSFDLCFGAAKADTSALTLLTNA